MAQPETLEGNKNDGAKEARREIKRFQEHLNAAHVIPDQCYRMASSTYPLVCYVNQITGLFLSKNYYIIPLFLQRAHHALLENQAEKVSEPYRHLVEQYLSHVAHFMVNYHCLADDEQGVMSPLIPAALLKVDPKALSDDFAVFNQF